MGYFYGIKIDREKNGDVEVFGLKTRYARNRDDIEEEMLETGIIDYDEADGIISIKDIDEEDFLACHERFESAVDV